MSATSEHNKDTEKNILSQLRNSQSFERGFSLLVHEYKERLYWHIRNMVQNHDDADEVLQNTFIKVFKGFKNFRGDAKLYTWLYRIASNESITFLNKRKKQATIDIDNEDIGLLHVLKADSYFDSEKATLLLNKALEILPTKQKQVFIMRYFDQLAYKDISAVLETSIGGLKASYHHAVKKIEVFIKENV